DGARDNGPRREQHLRHLESALPDPTEHGQRRHDHLALQRADVLRRPVRHVLHRPRPGRRRLAPGAHRAEPAVRHDLHGHPRAVVGHLPVRGVRGGERQRLRAAPLVLHHVPDGPRLRARPGQRVPGAGDRARDDDLVVPVRVGLLPDDGLPRPARHRWPRRLRLPPHPVHHGPLHAGTGDRGDRGLLLLALRRRRVGRALRHDLPDPL
ncbi:MAG: Cytochrome c oxidase polypeptide III, partial [uncultured Blastococcus sp.]